MKRVLSVCFVLFALLGLFALQASAEEETPLWEYEECDGGIVVTAYNGTAEDVFVPGTIDDKQVVKLADGLFADNDGLNSVTLGIGITEIGAKAFYDCDNLVCILISEELTTIGAEAFYSCDSFNSVILYDSVTTIDENAFSQCPNLTVWCNESSAAYTYVTANSIAYEILNPDAEPEIVTLDGIEYYIMNGEAVAIDFDQSTTTVCVPAVVEGCPVTQLRETFRDCVSLTAVTLPDSLKTIGDYVFYNCTNLAFIDIPDIVSNIGQYAFYRCTGLQTVTIGNGVISIGYRAFYACSGLTEVIIGNSVTSIGSYAFYDCISLTYVTIPDSVTTISSHAFYRCTRLTELAIPDGVNSIDTAAFSNCTGLVSVTIGNSVTIIGKHVFSYCTSLTSVAIPDSVTSISDYAFYNCTGLTSITIPDSVTSISGYAFYNCSQLTSLIIPESVTKIGVDSFPTTLILIVYEDSYAYSYANSNDLLFFVYDGINEPLILKQNGVTYFIPDEEAIAIDFDESATTVTIPSTVEGYSVTQLRETFRDCSSLTAITLPEGLKTISNRSFYYCKLLSSINIPNSVTSIGDSAFYNCQMLKSVTIPNGVTSIGNGLFNGCNRMTSVTIPNSVTRIGDYAFYGTSLTEITIPDKVTQIGSFAFYYCDGLTTVNLPDSVTSIGDSAFYGCSKLTSVIIPNSITKIGNSLFRNCSKLTSVIISNSVTEIGSSAFANCSSLSKVIIPESVSKMETSSFLATTLLLVYVDSYAHSFAQSNKLLYFVYDGINEPLVVKQDGLTYCVINGEAIAIDFDESTTTATVPVAVEGYPVTQLWETFRDCDSLTVITLSEGLKTIGDYSFYNCSALASINIPNSATIIGDYAFHYCNKLLSVIIPNNIVEIGNYTFSYCTALTSVNIPNSVTAIGDYAFHHCNKLTSISIPDSVTVIGDYVFRYCISLTEVTIPDSVISISDGAFDCCYALKEVKLPDSLTSIGDSAFDECIGLTSITIPDSVTVVGDCAFRYCKSLTLVTIPNKVISIGDLAFYNCTELISITIPDSVTDLGQRMFYNCTNLARVTIGSNVTNIGYEVFSGCALLKTVIIPENVTRIDTTAFPGTTVLMVYEDSYAHKFSVENNLLYFVLHKTENPEISYGAAISGMVTYTDGTAAAGAVVEILYDDGTVKESVTTDSTGAYAFTYAEVGRYTVCVTDAEGNTASTQVSVKRMNVFDVFLAGDTNLTLKKGWTVSGTVSETTAVVTITDENGNILGTVETADGSFTFENIPNGSYIIKAETENGTVTQEITVFNGAVSELVLTVNTENVTVWGYVEVEDREYNHHRRNWVQVSIYNEEGIVVAQTKSDQDGMYRFQKLPAGQYSIVAQVAEMRPDKHHHYDRSHTLTGYAYVDAAAAGEYQVDTIILYEENDALTTISGKVTAQGESQACQVVLRNVFRQELAQQTTGNNGKYTFTNIRDGLYFITAVTESEGMGYTVVAVRNGKVYGNADITVFKADKIRDREERFHQDFDGCKDRDTALKHKDRIVEEKRFYDGLSEKEKKQLSKEYIEHLNRMCQWITECEYVADDGITVEQGGLVISGDELENENTVSFEISVEKTDAWTANAEGVKEDKDFIYHDMHDKAGSGEIKQYYEISMFKTVDGKTQQITSVTKDTDTTGKFRITMEIPEEYRGYKHYTMLHVHNGETVTLADLDDDPNTVTFEVDAFSTFALTASDEILVPVIGAEVWDAELKGSYTTLEEAIAGSIVGQYIKLTADAEVNLTLDRDLYIDLDGHSLSGLIVTNGYNIYGMDSITDGYACDGIGYFNCVDENGNPVVPEKHFKTDAAMTGNVLRYMAIKTDEGYSFHRFYLAITHQSLKPTTTGVGYKAVFYGDAMVAANLDSFGFTMTLGNYSPKTVTKDASGFVSGKTVTLRIDDFDVDNYGETELYASVMLQLSDGTVIESTQCTMTMRNLLETLNTNYTALTADQLTAVADMIQKYVIISTWKVENLI